MCQRDDPHRHILISNKSVQHICHVPVAYYNSIYITLQHAAKTSSIRPNTLYISKSATTDKENKYFYDTVKEKAYQNNLKNNFSTSKQTIVTTSCVASLRLMTYSSPLLAAVHYYNIHKSPIFIQQFFFCRKFKFGRHRSKEINSLQGFSFQGYVYKFF